MRNKRFAKTKGNSESVHVAAVYINNYVFSSLYYGDGGQLESVTQKLMEHRVLKRALYTISYQDISRLDTICALCDYNSGCNVVILYFKMFFRSLCCSKYMSLL